MGHSKGTTIKRLLINNTETVDCSVIAEGVRPRAVLNASFQAERAKPRPFSL